MEASTPNSVEVTPSDVIEEFDRSAPLDSSKVLHRALQDDSGNTYYVYVPAQGAIDAPVLVAIHDIDRDGQGQADALHTLCEKEGVVLVVPSFSRERFPNYQRLGRSRDPVDERRSSNEILERVLDEVALLSGASTERFHLFGFGGGGRFAMRYAMLKPERINGCVIAQPGAYTFPNPSRRFPKGIAPSSKRPDFAPDPHRFLRVPMTLIESEDLDEPESKEADVGSGPVRLEEVDAGSGEMSAEDGRKWSEAMAEAARDHDLQPMARYEPTTGSSATFAAFAADPDALEQVFDLLFSSVSGALGQGLVSQVTAPDERVASPLWTFFNSPEFRKWAIPTLVGVALLSAITPVFLWAQYRLTHVVSRDAVLRGHIADVGAQLDGVVKAIEVDSGDLVAAGQIIARLEDRHFEAKRSQARFQLEKAVRELEIERLAIENERSRQKSSLRGVSADFSASKAELLAAQSRADEAQRRLGLRRSLAEQGLVAQDRVREAETELRTAQALVSAARAESSSAAAGQDLARDVYDGLAVREKRISVLESEISGFEAELALAEANLASATIRAPEDGAVVRRIVEPGSSTVAGQPIISVWLGEEIWVEAWIDEDQIGQIEVGSRATVTFKSHPGLEFGGVVESLAVATDIELPDSEVPQRRQDRMRDAPVVSARVKLDPHEEDLFPGLSAVVAIEKKAS